MSVLRGQGRRGKRLRGGGCVKKGCEGVGDHFLSDVFDGCSRAARSATRRISKVLLVRITAGNRGFQLILNFLLEGIYTLPEGSNGWVEREGCPFPTDSGHGC